MTQWKYMKGGQQYGPADTEAVVALLRDGTLTLDTMVMKEGGVDWLAARAFPELARAVAVGVPPAMGNGSPPFTGAAAGLDPVDIEKNKVFAVLAYIGILFLVPLLAAKESPFARYHTNQGILLFLTAVGLGIGGTILSFIPFLGCIISLGAWICILVLMVMGVINAISGKYKPLPLIGKYTILK